MSETLFKEINFSLLKLIEDVHVGHIGLPDLQRPFVWPNTKVRDLFDSMYRGYPVGYLLFWENGAAPRSSQIGVGSKQTVPQLLVIDGQQRLTSLYAVIRGARVKRQNFAEEKIKIAFSPLDGSFKVADAAIARDPTWIPDISVVWDRDGDMFELADSYIEGVADDHEIEDGEKRRIRKSIQRLASLTAFPFTALQLSASLDEEQVAEVFVRVNSKGTPLNQADFILTLMSVFRDQKRSELEEFCRQSRVPSVGRPSPFNYFIEPDPDHLLRVSVGLGFRRARLQHVYSILRGKDLETGEFSEQRREEQFGVLDEAQDYALDLQYWHEFLKCLLRAGYRSGRVVSSRNALLYAYAFYLIGKRDYGVDPFTLRNAIARWFYFISLTGRYTDSPETRMEQDLADLRGLGTAQEFLDHLDRRIDATFTNDYWEITLPGELATSSARSPGLFAYYAALNLLDAQVLFSSLRVSELMDPATKAKRSALERHHLFPKAYLQRQGIQGRRDTNQIANYALVEWPDNADISDDAPMDYFPRFRARVAADEMQRMMFWHALPEGWHEMPYPEFLRQRRAKIAQVIRAGYERLRQRMAAQAEAEPDAGPAPVTVEPAEIDLERHFLDRVPAEARGLVEDLLGEPAQPRESLTAEIAGYLAKLEVLKDFEDQLDIETARRVADRCTVLLDQVDEEMPQDKRRLIQAAALYFLLDEDAESDVASAAGFLDDAAVVEAAEAVVGAAGEGSPETYSRPGVSSRAARS